MGAQSIELGVLREVAALGPGGTTLFSGPQGAMACWLLKQKLVRGGMSGSRVVVTGLTAEGRQRLRDLEAKAARFGAEGDASAETEEVSARNESALQSPEGAWVILPEAFSL